MIVRAAEPCLHKNIIPAAKPVGADLLETAAPEIAEVAYCRKILKVAAKSKGRENLRKQTDCDSRKKTASRVISIKSSTLLSRLQRDIFKKMSYLSCSRNLVANLLWQHVELLQKNSLSMTMCRRPTNKKIY